MSPRITVSPERALVDERLEVEATGFDPRERVTIAARGRSEATTWESSATFEADDAGVVNPGAQAPVEGDYSGVRPMGLFQFARTAEPGDLAPGETRLRVRVDDEVVATATCERRVLADPVTRTRAGTDDVVGDVLLPPGDGPHPGVVILGGPGGGRPVGPEAKLLASRGYAVLALAYFGVEGLPPTLREVPLEYFDDAITWFGAHERVLAEPIGVLGHSRGAEAALLTGARNHAVRTVVAYAPPAHAFEGLEFSPRRTGTAAWSENGHPVTHVEYRWGYRRTLSTAWNHLLGRPVSLSAPHAEGLARTGSLSRSKAAIPLEEVDGPVLLVSGEDDAFWPATEFCDLLLDRLEDRSYDHPYDHLAYGDAGHAIGPPYRPVNGRGSLGSEGRFRLDAGGTPEGYARADADAWAHVLEYLEMGLRPETGPERIR
jgi:dienelactone hydrolase